jgi:excinuclease ABC subunit C
MRDISNIGEIPEKTGCYLFRNKENQIMYIGKAKNLRKRVFSHFQETNKSKDFVPKIEKIETFITKNSKEAFILEQKLIEK